MSHVFKCPHRRETNWFFAELLSLLCRILINEINTNHGLRTPEALARNVVLIRELNNNTAKVVSSLDARSFVALLLANTSGG